MQNAVKEGFKFLKCYYDQNLMSRFFSAYHNWLYLFQSLKWTLAPSKWKYWAWKCRFFASAITNLCSSDKAIVLWLWRHFLNAPRKQTWTVRKQRAILKASLVFARFWNCEGGNHRLRWLCRTSTDWIWESQILRVAKLREGKKTHFTYLSSLCRRRFGLLVGVFVYVLAIIIIHRQDDRESAPISPAF